MSFSSASGSYGCRMLAEIRESTHEWTWESWHRNTFQESRPVTSVVSKCFKYLGDDPKWLFNHSIKMTGTTSNQKLEAAFLQAVPCIDGLFGMKDVMWIICYHCPRSQEQAWTSLQPQPSKDYHMKNYGVFLYRDFTLPGRPLVRHVSGRSFLSREERLRRGYPAERPLISRRVKEDLTQVAMGVNRGTLQHGRIYIN